MIVANSGRDITSCAHGCLSMPGCLSFNFGEDVSLCELNNSSSTRHLQDFTVRPGFVYGHWITLAVIQYVFTTLGAEGPVGPDPGMLERTSRAKSNLIMAFKSGQFLTQVCIASRCLVLQERTGPVLEKSVQDGDMEGWEQESRDYLN